MKGYLDVYSKAYYRANKAEVNRKGVAINRTRRHERTRRHKYHRAVLDELKATTPCLDCKGSFKPSQMDFDHIDPDNKIDTIARMTGEPTERLLAEIKKCHLVCANCHRVRGNTGQRPNSDQGTALVAEFLRISECIKYPEDERTGVFAFEHLLGTMSDVALAKQTGTSQAMVGWYRRRLGIPAFRAAAREVA